MSDTTHTPLLLTQRDARGVHTLTLNAPRSFNVLSEAMMAAMQAALDAVAADPQARAVLIAANGRAFCAGHDLKEMKAKPDVAYYQALFATCSKLMMSIRKLEVPVIARVQGLATAAGCQLVAQCDLAVAVSETSFGVNGIDVGLFCATPSVALSRNMLPKQAMEMLLTGDFISAEEAKSRGLVNRVVATDALDAELAALVDRIVAKPREALAMGKALFYRQLETGMESAYQLAGQTMACNMVHEVAQEGVQAFIDKRAPHWRA
ncbi:MAG: enoyl-CoA hydratase [Burkholderiales bacterium RIFCSPLOWO2_12_67_14]|nr:MAG: enoyl-CoA hydratase [Burkholderiales bacterium RIFCSPLOWO2_02_FULL_67_64]OGB37450.1 MAG: enoyl-CoA hydratase [Burkholderiales bacterium RIFCSPHIGHO2_12_FULL_67_38]OGB41531.1 MAG: enoyl-CoA hydratase [Burkholderiales bacterium RIFCSPLOWO2_12_67_14]